MTDQQLLTELQYALLEPPDGGASWPSEVWTRAEVLDAVSAAIRALLRDTHLLTQRTEIAVLANATSVALPADWLATALVVWRTAANVRVPLGPIDETEADLGLPAWETTVGRPIGFADMDSSTLTFRLVPTPDANGTVELLYIPRPADITGAGGTLPVPDEFASAEKYGALSTLLSKVGRLQDPDRAAYCDQRVAVAETAAEILLSGWA